MVSVVITAYNVGEYIDEAIESVLSQTFKDLEIVVVLDRPTDDTEEKVRVYERKDERVKVISNAENVGAGLSRRAGIKASQGEYIILLDGDDYFGNDTFIADLYARAIETGAEIVSGGIKISREDGAWDATCYGSGIYTGNEKITKFWGERIVFMNNKLIARRLHDVVEYCHRRYIEDTPVIIPQMWFANAVAYVENIGYVYRMRETSLTHTTNTMKDVIYKGLCWCDLIDFFNAYDKSVFECMNIKGYISNIIKIINAHDIKPEEVRPYLEDWAELCLRLANIVKIKEIAVN